MPILFIMLSNVVTGLKLGTIALEFTTLTKVAVIGLGHIYILICILKLSSITVGIIIGKLEHIQQRPGKLRR